MKEHSQKQLEETLRIADQTIANLESHLADPLLRHETPAASLLQEVRALRREMLAELDRLGSGEDRAPSSS